MEADTLHLFLLSDGSRIDDNEYLKSGSRKIPPGKIPTRKIPTHQTPPWKIPHPPPPENSHPENPTWNIPTHFINCLSSLFLHLILRP